MPGVKVSRFWWWLSGLFLSIVFVDQGTKIFVDTQKFTGFFLGAIRVQLQMNSGLAFGAFSHLPYQIRVVTFATFGLFLFCSYLMGLYLMDRRLRWFPVGLTFVFAGILSNVIDRIRLGAIIDFIYVPWPPFPQAVFNLADALQWLGYGICLIGLSKEISWLWPRLNHRNSLIVMPHFQKRFCWTLLIVGAVLALLFGAFMYTFLHTTMVLNSQPWITQDVLMTYLICHVLISLLVLGLLGLLGIQYSHRIAGPLFSFIRYTKNLISSESPNEFRLRNGDELKELEIAARDLQVLFSSSDVAKKIIISRRSKSPRGEADD